MIIGTVRILPAPGRHSDVLEVLRSVQGPVRAQADCAACEIYEEQGPEAGILFIERWESDSALETHLRSEMFRRVLGAVELSRSSPDIRFEHVSSREGIASIERSRHPGDPTSR